MLCYFDSDQQLNLSHIESIRKTRSIIELQQRIIGFDFVYSKDYKQQGIYLIETSNISKLWCAKTFSGSYNLLLNLSGNVIRAAKARIIRIVIIATVEGDNFELIDFDGYRHLHDTTQLLGLPTNSVCIVSGNLNAQEQYQQWCATRELDPCIEFLPGVEWDGKNSNLLMNPVTINDYGMPFNSLNRSHRPHRTEHLYFIAENKLSGLISGGAWFDSDPIEPPIYQYVDFNHYYQILKENYPKIVDIDDLKTQVPNNFNNHQIYETSQLSVITESHYDHRGGLFITEKTFRPLSIGHPFMILGQKGTLDKLQSWGFRCDFDGIDQSYDSVEDDRERFRKFHLSLYNWCCIDPEIRKTSIYKWRSAIEHNFQLYHRLDFKKNICDSILSSTKQYFTVNF